MLQDCFSSTNWDVFKTAALREDCSVDLEEYTSVVTSYTSNCIDDIVPTKCCKIYPNQKPWINREVRSMLHAHSTAFASGDADGYKKARYDLRRSIREAKRQYRLKLEGYYNTSDSKCMWQGSQHITSFQQKNSRVTANHNASPDELYAHFDTLNTNQRRGIQPAEAAQSSSPTVTLTEVSKVFRRTNTRKAAGPDNIPGCALRACSSELAKVFTDIFNLSLSMSSVPTCFKTTTIVPFPKKNNITGLNDYRPIGCFHVMSHCCIARVRNSDGGQEVN